MTTLNIYCEEQDFSALAEAFEGEISTDCPLSCEIVFSDKSEIRQLNARTRQIDAVTDVLSYPALDGILGKKICKADFPCDLDDNGAVFLGSIAICKEVAAEQGEEYGHGYERELYYLAVHGICHLLGYDHMTEEDKEPMRKKEEKILSKIGLTR